MRASIHYALVTIVCIGSIYGIVAFNPAQPVTYDCRSLIGGWHPDVPAKVMEECKKLKTNNV